MGGPVGGTPWMIASGAGKLGDVANWIDGYAAGVKSNATSASGAAGEPNISASLDRFGAAFNTYVADLAAQFGAASTLALHGSQDLSAAGGQGGGPTGPQRPR